MARKHRRDLGVDTLAGPAFVLTAAWNLQLMKKLKSLPWAFSVYFLRQGLTIQARLALNLLCSQGGLELTTPLA